MVEPTDCPRGSYCTAGAIVPSPCPIGTYSRHTNLRALADCWHCIPGWYCGDPSAYESDVNTITPGTIEDRSTGTAVDVTIYSAAGYGAGEVGRD